MTEIVLLHTRKNPSFEMSDGLRQQLNAERVNPQMLEEMVQMLFHYDVLPSTDTPVLISWFVGPVAMMMERLDTKLVGQICHEVLCNYLKISPQKYPLVNVFRSDIYMEFVCLISVCACVEVHGIAIHTFEDRIHFIPFVRRITMQNNCEHRIHLTEYVDFHCICSLKE